MSEVFSEYTESIISLEKLAQTEVDPLSYIVETVREMSRQTDPQTMVSLFRERANLLFRGDQHLSLSRRGLTYPWYRITRSTLWQEEIDPWKDTHLLPLLEGGLLAELIYEGKAEIIRDVDLAADDPAIEHLGETSALVCFPLYDHGESLNMVIRTSTDPTCFDRINLPHAVFETNLFGKATLSLVLARRLQKANDELDQQMKRVGEIQRSLLPASLPEIPNTDLAVSYKPATRAGGDYYDFFKLDQDRWGILIADVSGHGTPAAVIMAMLRTMLHTACHDWESPCQVLTYANKQLIKQAQSYYDGTFVTAFYGVYDSTKNTLRYSSAGHNPPLRVSRLGKLCELDQAQYLPLAVDVDTCYKYSDITVESGDTLLFYTDGITEASNDAGEMYGRDRLLSCMGEDVPNAQHIIDCIIHKVMGFCGSATAEDDQTLLAMRILS